jgi:excisionase family DNA binding protein
VNDNDAKINDVMQRLVLVLHSQLERIALALERDQEPAVARVEPLAVSRETAAALLGVPLGTIEQLIRERRIGHVRLGAQRGRVIPLAALKQFIAENAEEAVRGLPERTRR